MARGDQPLIEIYQSRRRRRCTRQHSALRSNAIHCNAAESNAGESAIRDELPPGTCWRTFHERELTYGMPRGSCSHPPLATRSARRDGRGSAARRLDPGARSRGDRSRRLSARVQKRAPVRLKRPSPRARRPNLCPSSLLLNRNRLPRRGSRGARCNLAFSNMRIRGYADVGFGTHCRRNCRRADSRTARALSKLPTFTCSSPRTLVRPMEFSVGVAGQVGVFK